MFKLVINLHNNSTTKFRWINCVKSIFDETGGMNSKYYVA